MPKTNENTGSARANGVIDLIGEILPKNLITHKEVRVTKHKKIVRLGSDGLTSILVLKVKYQPMKVQKIH